MKTVNEKNNFIYLTGSMIGLLLCSALIDSLPEDKTHLFLQGVVFLTFIIGYLSLNFGTVWRRFVVALLVLLIISNLIQEFTQWRYSDYPGLFVMLLYFTGAAYRSSRQVLFSGEIDRNIIVGSIAIFLLLGLVWSMLYLITMEISATALVKTACRHMRNPSQVNRFVR